MRQIPVDFRRSDWPRLVANTLNDTVRRQGRVAVRAVSAAGDIAATDGLVLVDATSGAVTMTLPPAATVPGMVCTVKKVDASVNAVTVEGNGAETIDGAANTPLAAQYDAVTVASDDTEWWIL